MNLFPQTVNRRTNWDRMSCINIKFVASKKPKTFDLNWVRKSHFLYRRTFRGKDILEDGELIDFCVWLLPRQKGLALDCAHYRFVVKADIKRNSTVALLARQDNLQSYDQTGCFLSFSQGASVFLSG